MPNDKREYMSQVIRDMYLRALLRSEANPESVPVLTLVCTHLHTYITAQGNILRYPKPLSHVPSCDHGASLFGECPDCELEYQLAVVRKYLEGNQC